MPPIRLVGAIARSCLSTAALTAAVPPTTMIFCGLSRFSSVFTESGSAVGSVRRTGPLRSWPPRLARWSARGSSPEGRLRSARFREFDVWRHPLSVCSSPSLPPAMSSPRPRSRRTCSTERVMSGSAADFSQAASPFLHPLTAEVVAPRPPVGARPTDRPGAPRTARKESPWRAPSRSRAARRVVAPGVNGRALLCTPWDLNPEPTD